MLFIFISREELLGFLPKGGRVAEIGVAEGEFSRAILDVVAPGHLHLIDPWAYQADGAYVLDPSNVSVEKQEARFAGVKDRFAREIQRGQVMVHRCYSAEAAELFPERSLDWVYIDGLHSYQGVMADLTDYLPKIKADGFILGHDYTNHEGAKSMGFGVVEAVNEFVKEHQIGFLALTAEAFPSFVLAKDIRLEAAQVMMAQMIYRVREIVEIRDSATVSFNHELIRFSKDQYRILPSFG